VAASKTELNYISAEVAAELVEELNADLKDSATNAGWPSRIVSSLSVKKLDGSIYIDYPSVVSNEILDLEYGTETTQPSAVMRKFKNRNADKIAKLTVDAYADWFTKTGGGVF
jgi:hypothetical protein